MKNLSVDRFFEKYKLVEYKFIEVSLVEANVRLISWRCFPVGFINDAISTLSRIT